MFGFFKKEETIEKKIYYGDVEEDVAEASASGASKIELVPIAGSESKLVNGKTGVALEYILRVTKSI